MRSVKDKVRKVTKGTFPVDGWVWKWADDADVGVASDRVWWPVRDPVWDHA